MGSNNFINFNRMYYINKLKKIILHHSAISTTAMALQFNAIKAGHIRNGWGDIGYHYLIERNGVVMTGRNRKYQGAHCYGQNGDSIGICLAGNFQYEKPSLAQIESLKRLLSTLKKEIGDLPLTFHRNYRNTSCPGKNINTKILLGYNIKMADYDLLKRFNGKYVQRVFYHGEVYRIDNFRAVYLQASPSALFDSWSKELKDDGKLIGISEKNWLLIKNAVI